MTPPFTIDRQIGYDLSTAVIYRPRMSQNIVLRGSYAHLLAGDGYDALFSNVRATIASADLAFGNLETPVTLGGIEGERVFHAPPDVVTGLSRAGFDLLGRGPIEPGVDLQQTLLPLQAGVPYHVALRVGAD